MAAETRRIRRFSGHRVLDPAIGRGNPVTLAERRVSSGSVGKILLKMLRSLPGLRSKTAGRFYYPRRGFGQIAGAMCDAARQYGADFRFESETAKIERNGNRVTAVVTRDENGEKRAEYDLIISTIPLTVLVSLMDPPPPPDVVNAAISIRFRGMILIYLVLETGQFSEFDAHYFPEPSIPISRMSEPKNYSGTSDPKDVTVLCAELPCDPGEKWWKMTDAELGEQFCGWLKELGLPVIVPVRRSETRRLSHASPVYDIQYQVRFDLIDNWLLGLDGILVFGRQGLFALTTPTTRLQWPMARLIQLIAVVWSIGKNGHATEPNSPPTLSRIKP